MKKIETIPTGGILTKAGSSKNYKTGNWRALKPIWNRKRCTHCLLCFVYCPENCIKVKEGKRRETNLEFCKGCLVCVNICPVKAIEVKPEKIRIRK